MRDLLAKIYESWGAKSPINRIFENAYFGRPFGKSGRKILMLYCPSNPVAFSQIYPFFFYESDIEARYDISIRALPLDRCYSDLVREADLICVQTEFFIEDYQVDALFTDLKKHNPNARFAYFDWFAPLDLRLAEILNPHIDLYVKRQVFRDLKAYDRPTLGDTNLTDYYSRAFKIKDNVRYFPVLNDFFSKIILGPGLLTGPHLLNKFASGKDLSEPKNIDLHARFAKSGTPWYSAMRTDAYLACQKLTIGPKLSSFAVVCGGGVSRRQYLSELAKSKICFSPFGYGEVCWRDYEAALYGALLLKPDMSHVRTDPEIFVKDETYVSLSWDLSDLAEKVEFYLNHAHERNRIVDNAYSVMRAYFANKGFLQQMSPIFDLAHGRLVNNALEYPYPVLPSKKKAGAMGKLSYGEGF